MPGIPKRQPKKPFSGGRFACKNAERDLPLKMRGFLLEKITERGLQAMERNEKGYMKDDNQESKAKPLLVMKFGGTSVGGPKPIERVASLVEKYAREGNSLVVVVSAIRGVTNNLVDIGKYIQEGNRLKIELGLEDIFYRHLEVAGNLNLPHPLRASLDSKIEELYSDLSHDALGLEGLTSEQSDKLLSWGEKLNVRIVQAKLASRGLPAEVVEATDLIETDDKFGEASPNMEKTTKCANDLLLPMLTDGVIPVVAGFIGTTRYGKITTLGRGGSDYTASILGKVLEANEVWIWTDVDGVYDADPRYNPNAQLLPGLSQIRAHHMAMNGARVLYPKTVEPLIGTNTVLRVKNTFNPNAAGTKIYIGRDDNRPKPWERQ